MPAPYSTPEMLPRQSFSLASTHHNQQEMDLPTANLQIKRTGRYCGLTGDWAWSQHQRKSCTTLRRKRPRHRSAVVGRLALRIVSCTGVQLPQQVRECGDASDARSRRRRAALLLERDSRRNAFDLIDFRHRHLVKQPPGIGRYRFQIPALSLGVQCPEGRDDFPEPEVSLKTTSESHGMSTSTFFRLCSRAPQTRTN